MSKQNNVNLYILLNIINQQFTLNYINNIQKSFILSIITNTTKSIIYKLHSHNIQNITLDIFKKF